MIDTYPLLVATNDPVGQLRTWLMAQVPLLMSSLFSEPPAIPPKYWFSEQARLALSVLIPVLWTRYGQCIGDKVVKPAGREWKIFPEPALPRWIIGSPPSDSYRGHSVFTTYNPF